MLKLYHKCRIWFRLESFCSNLCSGHVSGLKISVGLCEFQVKSKKNGVQQFTIDAKESGYFGVVVAAMAGKHKITVQPAIGFGSEGGIASIIIGELHKPPMQENPVKAKKAEKAATETATASV
jgi:hypothetical protein